MTEDLRTRLADILANTTAGFVPKDFERPFGGHGDGVNGHGYDGACALCRGEIETLLDAMMPVIEERLWCARNIWQGRCRWCSVRVEAAWNIDQRPRPHRMNCRYYVGSVEHHRSIALNGDNRGCACGTWWSEDDAVCPNFAELWRGPIPARRDLQ